MTQKDKTRLDYIGRINDVMNFVEKNLDKELPLELVSKRAHFSPFHFHRIFSAITGETIHAFIKRKRMERAASKLMLGTDASLTELAFEYGFKSVSAFSRAFKGFYGISPSEFRENNPGPFSKIRKTDSKNGQEPISFERYICSIHNILNWLKMNAQIEVKQMPELKVAGIQHIGQFDQIGNAYGKLMRWAGPKGLLQFPKTKTITVYHDDPKVTEISKVRQTACITLDQDVSTDGEVGTMTVDKGKFAVGRFEIQATDFGKAWDSMCVWVAENGYKNRDGDYYELYHNDHMQHPERKFILDICVPVE